MKQYNEVIIKLVLEDQVHWYTFIISARGILIKRIIGSRPV